MKSKFLTALAGFTAAGSIILSGTSAAAGSAAFSLSPASGTKDVNSTFAVGVYETGTDINVVTVNGTYDASKLQFVSDDCAGPFANPIRSNGAGSFSITCYVPAGTAAVSGTQAAAVLNFKAIAGSGNTAVTVGTSGSHIASAGTDQWNGTPVSGNYTLNTPSAPVTTPTTPAPTTTPTGSTSSNNSKNTATSTKANSAATNTSAANATPAVDSATTSAPAENKAAASDNKAKTVGVTNAKVTVADHTARNAITWTSLLVLVAAGTAIYWTYFRKQPVPVTVPVSKKATTKKSPAKKATVSKATTKSKAKTTAKKKA